MAVLRGSAPRGPGGFPGLRLGDGVRGEGVRGGSGVRVPKRRRSDARSRQPELPFADAPRDREPAAASAGPPDERLRERLRPRQPLFVEPRTPRARVASLARAVVPPRFLRRYRERAAFRRQMRRVVAWGLVSIVAYAFVFADGGLLSIVWRRLRIRQLEGQVAEMERRAARLHSEVDLRLNDRVTLERLAREKYGMAYPGEKIYRIVEVNEAEARRIEREQRRLERERAEAEKKQAQVGERSGEPRTLSPAAQPRPGRAQDRLAGGARPPAGGATPPAGARKRPGAGRRPQVQADRR